MGGEKEYKIFNPPNPPKNNIRGQNKEQLRLETLLSKQQLDI